MAFSANGTRLAVGSVSGLNLWDMGTMKRVYSVKHGVGPSLDYSPDGQLIAFGGNDRNVHVFSAETGKELFSFHGHTGRVTGVSFSNDSRYLASCGAHYGKGSKSDGTVRIWDVHTGKEVQWWQAHRGTKDVEFSPDGKWLATSGTDGVKLWEAPTPKTPASPAIPKK